MSLVGYPFADTFVFGRPVSGAYRNAAGELVEAGADVPRFDHGVDGAKLGLLVTPGETIGQTDRVAVVAGDWEVDGAATVLHEFAGDDGVVQRRAFYSQDVRATVNAVLRVSGHHRLIGAVPGELRNLGGYVRYRERDWILAQPIGSTIADQVIEDGTDQHRWLVER